MTHKNEHHLNIIFTGDDYDLIKSYQIQHRLTDDRKAWQEHCSKILMAYLKDYMDDLKVKFGGKDE